MSLLVLVEAVDVDIVKMSRCIVVVSCMILPKAVKPYAGCSEPWSWEFNPFSRTTKRRLWAISTTLRYRYYSDDCLLQIIPFGLPLVEQTLFSKSSAYELPNRSTNSLSRQRLQEIFNHDSTLVSIEQTLCICENKTYWFGSLTR